MTRAVLISGLSATLLLTGCPAPDNNPGNLPTSNVSLARDVQPILTADCAGCHSVGGFAVNAGIPVLLSAGDTHAQVVGAASDVDDTLTFVVPGDPDASYLLEKIVSDAPARGTRMPLFDAPLSADEIEVIRVWIAEGARDN